MSDDLPAFYDRETPRVSIVVLNYGKPKITIECLESLWEHTQGHPYEVIVVDNGGPLEAYEELAAYEGPHDLMRLACNRFFGEGNNLGAERAKGEFIVFMNNDVTVTEGWLEPLVDAFETDPTTGCAGPMFVYPNGELQEAGAMIDTDGSAVQIGKFQSPDDPRFKRQRPVDYVSAATVILKKADFDHVHGFDFRYEPAYYEDCDLCLKIASLGKKTVYVPASVVVHHESITTSDSSHGLQLSSIVEVNKKKFVRRWSDYLETGRHASALQPKAVIPANPGTSRKKAGFFTPYNIIPGGGERYLFSVMQAFAAQGYEITLILPELYSRLRISEVLDCLDLSLPSIDIVTFADAEAGEGYDFYFCLGNEILPSSRGMGTYNVYCCQFPFPSDPNEVRRRLGWISDYDSIVCYSDFVEQAIRARLSETQYFGARVEVVSPPVGLVASGSGHVKSGILSIGRFFAGGHCKRQDMMIDALRQLREEGVETELHLVGSMHPEPMHRAYMADCRRRAEDLPVTFHVDAPPEELRALLEKSLLYWHGAGFGVDPALHPEQCEHFGISVIEAMSAGVIPLVVGHGGPASIVENGISGHHYNTQDELVALSKAALTGDSHALTGMQSAAIARAECYSTQEFFARWADLVSSFALAHSRNLQTS